MSSLEFAFDSRLTDLEMEWCDAYDASIAARADYQQLSRNSAASAQQLDGARERLDRSEALKARVMAKIEQLGHRCSGWG